MSPFFASRKREEKTRPSFFPRRPLLSRRDRFPPFSSAFLRLSLPLPLSPSLVLFASANEFTAQTIPIKNQSATVASLALGRFVFTPQQRKASANPPTQNGKTHKEAGDRLAEVRIWFYAISLFLWRRKGKEREKRGKKGAAFFLF